MPKNQDRKHYIDALATLLVFAVFAVCIVLSIILGANVYKGITSRDSASYEMRTCTQYISNKIRSSSSPKSVSVISSDGISALRIEEEEDGDIFCTYIYCYDGWIRELYSSAAKEPSFSAGEKLLEMQSIDFFYDNGLVTVHIVTKDGADGDLLVNVRGAEVAA